MFFPFRFSPSDWLLLKEAARGSSEEAKGQRGKGKHHKLVAKSSTRAPQTTLQVDIDKYIFKLSYKYIFIQTRLEQLPLIASVHEAI